MNIFKRLHNLWKLSDMPLHYVAKDLKLPTVEPGEAIIVPMQDPLAQLLMQIKKENDEKV